MGGTTLGDDVRPDDEMLVVVVDMTLVGDVTAVEDAILELDSVEEVTDVVRDVT